MLRELNPEDSETERLLRNSFRLQWLTFVLLLSAMTLRFVLPDKYHSLLMGLIAVAVPLAFYTGFKVSYADGAVTSRYYLDARQSRWRFSLMNMLIFGLLGVGHVLDFPQKHDPVGLAVGLLFLLLPSVSLVMGPRGDTEEEIARILRHRAMGVGYLTAMAVPAAVTVVAMYWPAYQMTALAWGLFTTAAVPILTYVVLDWLSDREETE